MSVFLLKSARLLARHGLVALVAVVGLPLLGHSNAHAQAAAQAAAATGGADEFIRAISVETIDRISKDKDIQGGDLRKVQEFVDSMIMPNVNFERMTALSVGRAWRQATPEQQKRLMAEYRVLLVRTYAGALAAVRDQTVRMKPFRADANETDVIVRTEIVPKRGDAIQLDYRVEKSSNAWKIYDLNVMGVWLVETYRNQFGQEINNKGIDGLIQSLSDKNKSFADKKG